MINYFTYLCSPYTEATSAFFWYELSNCQISDGYQGQPWYYSGAYSAWKNSAYAEYDCYETALEAMEADGFQIN